MRSAVEEWARAKGWWVPYHGGGQSTGEWSVESGGQTIPVRRKSEGGETLWDSSPHAALVWSLVLEARPLRDGSRCKRCDGCGRARPAEMDHERATSLPGGGLSIPVKSWAPARDPSDMFSGRCSACDGTGLADLADEYAQHVLDAQPKFTAPDTWLPGMLTKPERETGRVFRAVAGDDREPVRFVQESGHRGGGWTLHIDQGSGAAVFYRSYHPDADNEIAEPDLTDPATLKCARVVPGSAASIEALHMLADHTQGWECMACGRPTMSAVECYRCRGGTRPSPHRVLGFALAHLLAGSTEGTADAVERLRAATEQRRAAHVPSWDGEAEAFVPDRAIPGVGQALIARCREALDLARLSNGYHPIDPGREAFERWRFERERSTRPIPTPRWSDIEPAERRRWREHAVSEWHREVDRYYPHSFTFGDVADHPRTTEP
jgi:hypothetical protein